MPTFKLTIAYDGAAFVGWQRQATGESIQGLLEDALAVLDGRDVAVAGAGRTDAGVHAIAQVAGVTLERDIDAPAVVRAVNARLPPAIRVTDAVFCVWFGGCGMFMLLTTGFGLRESILGVSVAAVVVIACALVALGSRHARRS